MIRPLSLLAFGVLATSAQVAMARPWWTTPPPSAPVVQTEIATPAPAQPAATAQPSLAPLLGADADKTWAAIGPYNIETSDGRAVVSSGTQAVYFESRGNFPAGIEVTGKLRFRPATGSAAYADFFVGRHTTVQGDKRIDRYLRLYIVGNQATQNITAQATQDGAALHDLTEMAKHSDWSPENLDSFTYNLRAFQQFKPGWPEDFRTRIEADMMSLPTLEQKWVSVRIELKRGLVRFWLDDHLVAWKQDASIDPAGSIRVTLTPGAELADFRTVSLPDAKNYLPIRLGGYLNGKTFADGSQINAASLPQADSLVGIKGVPFAFPAPEDGNNHLDIGRSLFRHANLIGNYGTAYGDPPTWTGSTDRDPARIQVRVPNGNYNALYLVAAAENRPDTIPLVTASFFKPGAGFSETFETRVPFATASSGPRDAVRLPVQLGNGKTSNLWLVKIPLDPGRLSSLADVDIVEIEFSKKMELYRTYPDPIVYGYHQAGLPSSVHIFAATLARTPINFAWNPDSFGHVWTSPHRPSYTATIRNYTAHRQTGKLIVTTRSYDGNDTSRREKVVEVPADGLSKYGIELTPKLFGYYDITATLEIAGQQWTERRSFVELAPDTRTPRWTEGKGALFGFWSYFGGHSTPNAPLIADLMTRAGARQSENAGPPLSELARLHWARNQAQAWTVNPQEWAVDDNPDPAKIAAFRKEILDNISRFEKDTPAEMRPDEVLYFTESGISSRLTAGNYPEYYGDAPYVYTDDEKKAIKMFVNSARLASEIVRKEFPGRKIMIGWTDPLFIVPLLRAGYPASLVDGSGLDVPGFERLPEIQLQEQAIHRLYELRNEFARAGIKNPLLQTCEGIFVPTEPGAVSYREQMDIYNRWSLLCMAYGVTRFHSGWFAFDCGNYYGAEHYGGCGIQRRIPYCDPKPAYAAYATMTDRLNEANFDGWMKTGSLSTYCLRFNGPRGNVYTLWTLRGKRPVTMTLTGDGTVNVTDAMDNAKTLTSVNKQVTFGTDQSVVYVTASSAVASVQVGDPDHSDAAPSPTAKLVADLGDGSWHYTSEHDSIYENDHYDYVPAAGKFSSAMATDAKFGNVLTSKLEKQDRERQTMPWYNTLRPGKPIPLPGAPSHLGLWVKGNSDWGRVIYVLRDAHGERWVSIGTKDQYNCNDTHCYSNFNFDGWRYVRFELPGHTGYDSFRKMGTTWWRADSEKPEQLDNIVDLPVSLEEIIVEQRSHILYVNDVQPAPSDTVQFGKLYAEYDTPADATPEAVRISRLRMPLPANVPKLPNPIADMERDGVGEPTVITGLKEAPHYNDGTNMHIEFKEVPGAKAYYLWISAHPDGSGAVNMAPGGIANDQWIFGLRPAIKLYYWIVYRDATGKLSKPSPRFEFVTVDNFKEK